MGVAIASILSVVPNAASHRGIQVQGVPRRIVASTS